MADNAVTLAKMASLARGKIIVGDSAGDPSALAIGSNGTVLKSDGTDASWGTISTSTALDDIATGDAESTLATSSGSIILDSPSAIKLDADGGEVQFKDGGTEIGVVSMGSQNMNIESKVADKDIIFKGIDGSSDVTALTLDMSDAGKALFGSGGTFNGVVLIDGLSNYTGLEVKGVGGSRPMLQFSNANNGDLGAIYGTEGNDLVICSGSNNTAAITIEGGNQNVLMSNLYVADDIGHSGDGDTYLSFENDFLGVYAGGVQCMATTSTGIKSGNIYFNGVSSNSQIEAGNVHFKVGAGIWMSGSSSLDLQMQVPVSGSGIVTAAKLDAPSGDWYTNDGTVSNLSDSRLKKEITTLSDGINIVKQLRPVTYKYDDTTLLEDGSKSLASASDTIRYGFVAQEVEAVASHYVTTREGKVKGETVSDLKSTSMTRMIPMLVKAIQELEAEVQALKG